MASSNRRSHALVLGFRHLDDLLEGLDLRVDHDAVGLRHLGGERDEAHGEHDVPRRRPEERALAIDEHVAGNAAEQRADRPAEREPEAGAAQLTPDRLNHLCVQS